MPIQQTKKQSDLEKRLRLLRQQVYGKEEKKLEVGSGKVENPTSHIPHPTSTTESFRTDITYLHQDLLKIFLLATLALGAQIILFYLMQNNLLKLNFF